MFEKIKENSNHSFYSVKVEDIRKAEVNMGIIIPEQLLQFYLEVGYGFLESHKNNINRVMGPSSLTEFFLGIGQFENFNEEIYNQYMKDQLFFFEVNESQFLSIGRTKLNKGKIYYYDKIIANNIEEFFDRYLKDEDYYLHD